MDQVRRSGYVRRSPAALLAGMGTPPPVWLPGDVADPFAFERDGALTVLAVSRRRGARGELRYFRFDREDRLVAEGRALREPWTPARPVLVEDDGELYLLLSPQGGGQPVLYRSAGFPDGWERIESPVDGPAILPVLFRLHGLWWLAWGLRAGDGEGAHQLHLAFAPRVTGPWTPHPLNPVACGRPGRPPAGALALDGGDVALPLAATADEVGGTLLLRRFRRLTPWEAEMDLERRPAPGRLGPAEGFRLQSLIGGPAVACFGLVRPARDRAPAAERRPRRWCDAPRPFAVHP